jgi:hypothetical protein
MSHEQGLQTVPTRVVRRGRATELDFGSAVEPIADDLPVLIQVPALRTARNTALAARRPSTAAIARVKAEAQSGERPRGRTRPRRRLRGWVKVAGSSSLTFLAIGLAAWSLHAAPFQQAGSFGRYPIGTAAPAVSLSVEGAEPAEPVVLPGYLLPDDGTEDPSHAGG